MVEWTRHAKGRLQNWPSVAASIQSRNLLLGNGSSKAIWAPFGYPSLFAEACQMPNQALPLAAQRIFDSLKTKNFETVLTALATTQTVNLALRIPRSSVIGTYDSVRNSLVHAVRSVHVPWGVALEPSLRVLRDEFRHYQTVFTTNYDLLAYWAIMLGGPRGDFSDYFLYGSFTPDQTSGTTKLLFLHGGLHLQRDKTGEVRKRAGGTDGRLLDTFGLAFSNGAVALFVSEGTSIDKRRAIRRSEYLRFALERLRTSIEPLVIFGQSLDPTFDRHIIDAVNESASPLVAISMRPGSRATLQARQRELLNRLTKPLAFFDSSSHPLGNPEIEVGAP